MNATGGPAEGRTAFAGALFFAGPRDLWPMALDLLAGDLPLHSRPVRARIRGALEGPAAALAELRPAFADTDLIRRSMRAAQADCMRLAAAGLLRETADMLEASPSGPLLGPMVHALRRRAGEEHDAPVEVVEVADEVLARIDALAATGDVWRRDPHDIVLPDEASG